jgi:ankyrin repeat protein
MRILPLLLLSALAFARDPNALLDAADRDDAGQVAKLLASGADPNLANGLGVTPLWAACQNGNIAIVRALLDAGSNPNTPLHAGETPLMVAARSGFDTIVSLLAAKGANPNVRATRGQTALMWAASQRHPAAVRALLAAGANTKIRTETWSQMMAVPPHGLPRYNRMIPHGSYTALLFAARSGDTESARLLLDAGADANDKDAWGVSATALAAHSGFRDLVDLLLARGANPNTGEPGFTPLHAAVMHRDLAMVRALLTHGADANAPVTDWTPTRRSSRDYHFPPSLIGATSLWLAARLNEPEIVRLLAKHGANPRFIHRVDYYRDYGQPRREVTSAVMAAAGMASGVDWHPDARKADREDAVFETVKVLLDLGAPSSAEGRDAISAVRANGWNRVAALLESRR